MRRRLGPDKEFIDTKADERSQAHHGYMAPLTVCVPGLTREGSGLAIAVQTSVWAVLDQMGTMAAGLPCSWHCEQKMESNTRVYVVGNSDAPMIVRHCCCFQRSVVVEG